MALIGTKLLGGNYHSQFLAVTDKYCAFAWSNEYYTVITIIYVYVGCHIKYEKVTVSTILYIKLLLFNGPYFFNSKSPCFISKSIVLRIIFLFCYFWFKNIGMKFRLFQTRFFILTNFRNAKLLFLFHIIQRGNASSHDF